MTNIPRDLLSDPSGRLSAHFLQDPENLYGLHGASTDIGDERRWLPTNSRRYASEEGLLPPIEPEIARLIGEGVGVLCRTVAEHFRNPVEDLSPVTE